MFSPKLAGVLAATKPKQNFGIGSAMNKKATGGVSGTIANGMNLQKRIAPTAALTNNRFAGSTGTLGTILKGLPEIQTSNPRNPAFDPAEAANAVVAARFKRK